MWSSDNSETTHLLSQSQRIKLSDTPKDLKSYASIYKSIAGIICLCLTTLAISSLFKHPSNPARQLLKASPSIRGGNDASGLDYPWMASWRFDDIHCCTGSLIHKNPPIILTAGTFIYYHLKSIQTPNTVSFINYYAFYLQHIV